MYFRVTPSLVAELAAIWPDPETGKKGINATVIVKHTGLSHSAVGNYLKKGRIPSDKEKDVLRDFFKIVIFTNDPDIDNAAQLKKLEDFFQGFSYK